MNFQYNNRVPHPTIIRQPSIQNTPLMGFSPKYLRFKMVNDAIQQVKSPEIKQVDTPQPKKMKWGEPTWFLLHTLAEKVKAESFSEIRVKLLNIVYTICTNLPCPDCSNHAKTFLDGVNFNTIQTKDQLKNLLFNFHNTVNKRKGFAIFNYTDLDEKYANAVTINMVYNFVKFFNPKNYSIRMIANDFHRNRITEIIKNWFNDNLKYFSP